MIPDDDLRRAVASLLYAKIATRRFVERTGARGFLHLTSGRSRVGKGLATSGPVTGGLRFNAHDRLVVIERCDAGYRTLVRAMVAGEVLVLYDETLVDLDGIAPALLDALGVVRT